MHLNKYFWCVYYKESTDVEGNEKMIKTPGVLKELKVI